MRTFSGYRGTRAVAELFGRLHDDAEADTLMVELGHTAQGHYVILLTDRDFRVILTTKQAEAVLRSLAAMVRAVPELGDDRATFMLGTALVEALDHVPARPTVH
jgi:CTP:molybdopterin cytidylyltransferase MocA